MSESDSLLIKSPEQGYGRGRQWVLRFKSTMAAALIAVCFSAPALAAAPFEGWAGIWRGDGSITMTTGVAERLRCRADVSQRHGDHFQQRLRCASDTYRVLVDATVEHARGRITGMWSDARTGVSGSLSGRLRGERMDAVVQASGFSADIMMTRRGEQRAFVIRPRQTDVREVRVLLRKTPN